MAGEYTKLPDGLELGKLQDNYKDAKTIYDPIFKRIKLIDGADRGKLWEVINAKLPATQLTPETNHVSEVKDAILGNIYTVGGIAKVVPKTKDQIDQARILNRALTTIWSDLSVPDYQLLAGERAVIANVGYTWVGWNPNIVTGTPGNKYKGEITLKNLDPSTVMIDPKADNIDEAGFVIYQDLLHKSVLLSNSKYAETFKAYLDNGGAAGTEPLPLDYQGAAKRTDNRKEGDGYYNLIIHYMKVDDDSSEGYTLYGIHTIDNKEVLCVEEVLPKLYPIVPLYCNLPSKDPVGISPTAKIFKNSVVYNIMHSIQATHAYKTHKPPRFISKDSQINVRAFSEYGGDPDKTWVVNGDASKAVHYMVNPDLPRETQLVKANLKEDIQSVSGVDEVYRGRDTGSITTTGGVENLFKRVSIIDATKIRNYNTYVKRLTRLILANYFEFCNDERIYIAPEQLGSSYSETRVNFKELKSYTQFSYTFEVSAYLPQNSEANANIATTLLEKQMQYQPAIPIITIEEWLLMQDNIPFKDIILERIELQKQNSKSEELMASFTAFSDLVSKGYDPDTAFQMVSQIASEQGNPERSVQNQLGNVQKRQQG